LSSLTEFDAPCAGLVWLESACVAGELCIVPGCFYLKSMSSSPDARRAFALSTSTSSFWAVVISSSCPQPLLMSAVLASLRALPSKGVRGPKCVDAVLHSSPQHRLAVNLKVPSTCNMKLLPDGLFGAACWRDVSWLRLVSVLHVRL